MPHSIEAEHAVLGAILLSQQLDGTERLEPNHFFIGQHQTIYEKMRELADQAKPVDVVSLTVKLQDDKLLDQVGGVSYLSRMSGSVPTATRIGYYVDLVHDKYLLREMITLTQRMAKEAWEADDPRNLIADIQSTTAEIADQSIKTRDFKTSSEVALKVFENVEDRFANFSDDVTGIPSGYDDLDKLTSGFQDSDLIIVAARPSVGKTAFALNIAQAAGIRAKKTVALISLEMSAEQLVQRMTSAEGNIDATKLRTGYMANGDWENLTMAVSSISESKIYIDDSPALTVREIASKCRRLHKSEGLDMIVIDYLQLISGRGKSGENRQQEVSDISRTLKQLARELNVPVIALSQLSRGVEQRQDKRPMMSDLRESGAIEQDADIVAFLYRDDYYDKESEKKNIIEIIIAKQRNGPVGTVELVFHKQFNKFIGIDRGHHSNQPSKEKSGNSVPDMYKGA
ncbi:replicative DNA helicase [Paenibacillus sp. FSL H8-0548]|uniref:replicative DNA helicase n=1 Tax=Paenibacillus sp. FSL H8-0548 TaxID=1920422 RepID=UPI0021171082|nr:replicative DNA helicase [Paenibacillus sp. FSL H8-0548]